ncbi:LacI family DNA-binding transcriptional regulator [Glycomyces sp. NPDC048151]|uniref:LacI family DNA-binding transcriptional regulator n=1 Tax=Glycomyces sp. NPDC048151 TaxID=3364002 RepID=UPI003722D2DA
MAVNGVGIRDVARLAGVSITTVSHVLNDTPQTRVSAETRARVREAAAQLGYGPNRAARTLRTNRSGLIGLLSEEIATTPHAGRIILGAQDAARAHDLTLVIVNAERESNGVSHEDDVRTLIDRQVEAILYATMYHRQVSVPANLRGVPAVLIDSTDRDGVVPAVVPDEVGGAVAAVTHLVEAGHRRIGFLNNDDDVPATHERLVGFKRVLHQHGIPVDGSLVLQAPSETLPGYALAREALDRPDRPTALFCYNDRMAMGAYRAAAELSLDIPNDLSIVGFDNQELIAANLFPGLTTVALPHYEMGEWAVEKLVHLLSGDAEDTAAPDGPTRLPCPLIVRGSVAAPREPRKA